EGRRVVEGEQHALLEIQPGVGQRPGRTGDVLGQLAVGHRPAGGPKGGGRGPPLGHVTLDEEGGRVERLGERFHRRNTTTGPSRSFQHGGKLCNSGSRMHYRILPRALRSDSVRAWRGVILAAILALVRLAPR